MNRIAFASFVAASLLAAAPASAVTNQDGEVLITQAAVNAGNITPGDTPGFPVTITVPGTYRLASNLTVTTQVNGIEVRANEVTIEMGGRTLAGSGIGRNGITSFNRSLTVLDGTVRGFQIAGVRSIAQFLTVRGMRILANGAYGVIETPAAWPPTTPIGYATVVGSTISGNTLDGIACTSECRIDGNTIAGNGRHGVDISRDGGLVLGNIISGNVGFGINSQFRGSEITAPALTGYGNNSLISNGSGPHAGGVELQPNACRPQAC